MTRTADDLGDTGMKFWVEGNNLWVMGEDGTKREIGKIDLPNRMMSQLRHVGFCYFESAASRSRMMPWPGSAGS